MTIRVDEPLPPRNHTIVSNADTIRLRGTLTGGSGATITWESNRGFGDLVTLQTTGVESSSREWIIPSIALKRGLNQIRIQARGTDGSYADTIVNVVFDSSTMGTSDPVPVRSTQYRGRPVRYQLIDGKAIYQGDIVLNLKDGRGTEGESGRGGIRPDAATIAPTPGVTTSGLWPIVNGVGRVPYTISARDQAVPSALATINAAVSQFNNQLSAVIQFVPATPSDVNLAAFDLDPGNYSGTCESPVGLQGMGAQTLGGSISCTESTILHEIGHTIGLWHEQSRTDRNNFVNFLYNNVDKPNASNFDQLTLDEIDSGLYNYASVMQYPAFEFSRDGISPTLESIPAGIVFGPTTPEYSTGDIDGIFRLYGHAPTVITVDTNPSGLSIVVDGTPYTAPHAFTWGIGTQHTLSVPLDSHGQTLQTAAGQNYIFGRWNLPPAMSPPVTQTITVSAGTGQPLNPTTSPAVTAYLASFIPIHLYAPNAYPSGSFTATPAPSSIIINGAVTAYYEDRQNLTLQANGPAHYNFYDWYTPNATLPSYYANPVILYDTTDLNNLQAVFVTDPVTTVAGSSPDLTAAGIAPGFAVPVDPGTANVQYAYTPRNFVDTYDGPTWAAGQEHQLCGTFLVNNACPTSSLPTESPVTTNIDYLFNKWTGAAGSSSNLLNVTVAPAGQTTYESNYLPSFRSIVQPSPDCGGNVVSPNQSGNDYTDAFFAYGLPQSFSATAGTSGPGYPGFAFVGWSMDLSGTSNPDTITIQDQILGTANFNTAGTSVPLTITGFSPSSTAVSTGSLDVTVNGTGFTTNASDTSTSFNGVTRSNTLISSTQLTIHLQPGDLGTAGTYPIEVLNAGNSMCGVYYLSDFAVTTVSGGPNLTVSKTHTGNFSQGQQGAQYTILVTNTGAGATDGSAVTVSDTAPSGLTLVSLAGSGWTCASGTNTCLRTGSLNPGLSYPAITVTVNVSATAVSPQINLVNVTGGGSAQANNGDSTTITTASAAAAITATGGTPQSSRIKAKFASPLQATVTDSRGNGVSGVVVTFTAPSSGASGTFAGGVNTATTNTSGVATSTAFTANSAAGAYTVSATVPGVTTPANFSLTNKPGPAASVKATGGTPQAATITTSFASPLQATVRDAAGNAVSGVVVTFTAPSSGASGEFAGGVATATTNASGVATSQAFTANSIAGSYTVTAKVSSVTTAASYSLTNKPGAAASIAATGGTPQSATVKTAFANPLQVTVKDRAGNLVSGVVVTFAQPTSGASGSFAGGVRTATTNASGVATSAIFTANDVAGSYTVTGSVTGVSTKADFSLTNLE